MVRSTLNVLTIPAHKNWAGNVILYLHGHSADVIAQHTHWPLLTLISKQTNSLLIAPEYSLTALNADASVFAEVKRLYHLLAARVGTKCLVAGQGIGAGLALTLVQQLQQQASILPRKLVFITPWLNIYLPVSASTLRTGGQYHVDQNGQLLLPAGFGGPGTGEQLLNPLQGHLKGLPPTSLFTTTEMQLDDDTVKFKHQMAIQGHPIDLFAFDVLPASWLQLDDMEAEPVRCALVKEFMPCS